MNPFSLFSSGQELANLVVASGLLQQSWTAIWDLHSTVDSNSPLPISVKLKAYDLQPEGTVIAFVSTPTCAVHHLQGEGSDLVSSEDLRGWFPLFDFVCTNINPRFSIHKAAATIFASLYDQLSLLKNQYGNSNPLIITGHSLGGSIASLFTLWLLEGISPTAVKRPLCITFGSPLLGDNGFQRAISERPKWNSCFIHLVSSDDPVPRFFASTNSSYKPFSTFLICSPSGCACFEEPVSIFELLIGLGRDNLGNQLPDMGLQIVNYGRIVEFLKNMVVCKENSKLGDSVMNPLRAGIILQLQAIGVLAANQQPQQNTHNTNDLTRKIEKNVEIFLQRKRNVLDPSKKLNDRKINMTYLEWYKKVSVKNGGYYDAYKNPKTKDDFKEKEVVVKQQRILTQYWKTMVKEAVNMTEGASFRTRWLYAGTNYRRLVEPLDIAEYYKKGKKDYLKQERSEHYKLLERWQREDRPSKKQNNAAGDERKKACSLTEDSCFWAHLEEALISCNVLKDGSTSEGTKVVAIESLIEFERNVMDMIRGYAVSPEIFLEQSSFMKWWREYRKLRGVSHSSLLTEFMTTRYREYA